MKIAIGLRAAFLSLALLVGFLLVGQVATSGLGKTQAMDPE